MSASDIHKPNSPNLTGDENRTPYLGYLWGAPSIINLRVAVKNAENEGFSIIRWRPGTLLVDLDSVSVPDFESRLAILAPEIGYAGHEIQVSKTPGHHHAIVHCDPEIRNPLKVLLLQAALGSDWNRELTAANIIRYTDLSLSETNVLFSPPPF